jgi:hypothetical protein
MNEEHMHHVAKHFPTFKNMDVAVTSSVFSLVIVLLPGIIAKLMVIGSSEIAAYQDSALLSPTFQNITLLIAFILAVYALVKSNVGSSARTFAILTLIVCIARFVLIG